MIWFSPADRASQLRNLLGSFALAAAVACASARPSDGNPAHENGSLARTDGRAEIECTTPDGRVTEVTAANAQTIGAAALIMDGETLSCPLTAGETTFVIKLPASPLLDRLTFINENAAAAGQLKISVSNDKLSADSPKWQSVDGSIAFARKRLFNLSMLGVEARYVRLSFQVQKADRIAALGL